MDSFRQNAALEAERKRSLIDIGSQYKHPGMPSLGLTAVLGALVFGLPH